MPWRQVRRLLYPQRADPRFAGDGLKEDLDPYVGNAIENQPSRRPLSIGGECDCPRAICPERRDAFVAVARASSCEWAPHRNIAPPCLSDSGYARCGSIDRGSLTGFDWFRSPLLWTPPEDTQRTAGAVFDELPGGVGRPAANDVRGATAIGRIGEDVVDGEPPAAGNNRSPALVMKPRRAASRDPHR